MIDQVLYSLAFTVENSNVEWKNEQNKPDNKYI